MRAADCADLSDRHDRTDLIISIHHRNKDRIVTQGVLYLGRCHSAEFVYRQVSDLKAFLRQFFTGMQYSVMLDLRSDNVPSLLDIGMSHAFNKHIITLTAAACKNDFLR